MPRLLAAEYVNTGAMGECFNDYKTPPPRVEQSLQQQQQHHKIIKQTTTAMDKTLIAMKSLPDSPQQNNDNPNNLLFSSNVTEQHQIHTISSSDENELVTEQDTIEEEVANISSNETEDFEGFDDYITPNSSGFINDASQEDHLSRNYLKRFSNTDFNNCIEDSEGVVEAIEMDEDEDISIGCDENLIHESKEYTTPKKAQMYGCEPHTPYKRKKQDNEHLGIAILPTDQVVEINSDSTTNSIKQKRQQINNKYQIKLSQQQLYKHNNANRCSTESTSEFPVSSPSNPQLPRGGKYPPRPPLLKNTLPADSFERQLAMITSCNPQMTLAEKIQSWDCDDELSDVEDVNLFDEEFKRLEKQIKLQLKQKEKNSRSKSNEVKNYDFLTFREKILNNMKEQKMQKFNVKLQGATGVGGSKCMETSGSESSKSIIHVDERPSTSAVAQQQLQQRRSKIQVNIETGESKKRPIKEAPKRNQNSTTPPQTSSSDNERDFFQNAKNKIGQKFNLEKVLCPSSSEEAFNQELPSHMLLKSNNADLKNISKVTTNRPPPPVKFNEKKISRALNDEEIDSVFRLHRLNRERDKQQSITPSKGKDEDSNNRSIIQMHLNFANENKTELLTERKQELFKTPTVPQKYLANFSPTKGQEYLDKENCTKPSAAVGTEDKSISSNENKDKTPERADIDGVYHQQHEFCNYLGLTGMSTATAMANAVAELAQCNLARRSMRVLRQQQERKDKTTKMENSKPKKQQGIRKREKESEDNMPQMETDVMEAAIKSEECSHSQTSEGTTSLKDSKKKTSNNSMTKSSTLSQHSVTIIKKEPEIKILCHISTKKQEEVKGVSKECVKEIGQPVRETLMRQVKQTKISKNSELCEENMPEQKENIKKINDKFLLTEKELKTDFAKVELSEKISQHFYELPSSRETPETVTSTKCTTKNLDTKNNKSISINENNAKSLIPPAPNNIQQKIKIALEESRKSKPSIFIVQSLESKKDTSRNLPEYEENVGVEVSTKVSAQDKIKATKKYSNKLGKNLKNMFKKIKSKKYPTSKRQLRNRKIIVIKSSKPKLESNPNFTEFKRELRSSPKVKELKTDNCKMTNQPKNNETKIYRTVQTETNDLELFLNSHSSQTKTRIRAKASALLERSKRISQRNRENLATNKSKNLPKVQRSKLTLHSTKTPIITPLSSFLGGNSAGNDKRRKSSFITPAYSKTREEQLNPTSPNFTENDNVVVSSTTNTFDERLSNEALVTQSPINLRSLHNSASYVITHSPIETKEQFTQCNITNGVKHLNATPLSKQSMRNPLKSDYGPVLYIYNELEILIVIQERLVSFWKYSKLINILTLFPQKNINFNHQTNLETTSPQGHNSENTFDNQTRQQAFSSNDVYGEWIKLGELRRLNFDTEIAVPYQNRICLHNSTPIYLEMRAHELPKNHRDCNLLSMYINIYYYHDEDMIAKCNSIQLDAIQSNIKSVNYTTLIDSRYFIMTWPQENLLGKTRSGLCKYSLTPQLDTLASIREFKNMRHTISYLQCMSDDKLIGFGDTQVTIWDHRSGDVLMNFDFEIPIGKNLGSVYFSSQDIELNNMLIFHQFRDFGNDTPPILMTIACTITHNQPSYRVLQEVNLPIPAFKVIKCAINTGDHLVVIGQNDDELWISEISPTSITIIPSTQKSKRFYNRERSQLIELREETLNVNSLTSYILQLAAEPTLN